MTVGDLVTWYETTRVPSGHRFGEVLRIDGEAAVVRVASGARYRVEVALLRPIGAGPGRRDGQLELAVTPSRSISERLRR